MKNLLILFLFALAMFGLNGCASTSLTSTDSNGDAVPGEKVTGEERMGAGVSGTTPNASVKW
ncbi:MAG TPA: hypothetical protein VG103_11315 [Chthoniobacterales bacterium]|nr:hypothetical protein [Chthoniobacterales bacterium]